MSEELSIGSQTTRPTADQWLYVAMAVAFVLVALVGFLPTSTELVVRVLAGEAPRPLLISCDIWDSPVKESWSVCRLRILQRLLTET